MQENLNINQQLLLVVALVAEVTAWALNLKKKFTKDRQKVKVRIREKILNSMLKLYTYSKWQERIEDKRKQKRTRLQEQMYQIKKGKNINTT